MRLELQLRGRKPAEWVDCAKSMLADFRLPNYDNIKVLMTNWRLLV